MEQGLRKYSKHCQRCERLLGSHKRRDVVQVVRVLVNEDRRSYIPGGARSASVADESTHLPAEPNGKLRREVGRQRTVPRQLFTLTKPHHGDCHGASYRLKITSLRARAWRSQASPTSALAGDTVAPWRGSCGRSDP